jgi:hypothetical protein
MVIRGRLDGKLTASKDSVLYSICMVRDRVLSDPLLDATREERAHEFPPSTFYLPFRTCVKNIPISDRSACRRWEMPTTSNNPLRVMPLKSLKHDSTFNGIICIFNCIVVPTLGHDALDSLLQQRER